ncbi:MAG TPA: hypothetical protein VM925_04350 [Labilithrix sp.]|nr:hypothetical protein [Labilithrix sp.]
MRTAKPKLPKSFWFATSTAVALATGALAACIADHPHAGDDGTLTRPSEEASCATPNEACPCSDVGAVVECGTVKRISGDYATCSIGKRTCIEAKTWGPCVGEVETRTVNIGGLIKTRALAGSPTTCANACDPYCQNYDDTPAGLVLPDGGGLVLSPEGLTLSPSGTFDITSCAGLTITPSTQTLTITGLSPVTPSTLSYTAALVPAGCYPGAVSPIWTVNDARADSVTIASSGSTGTLTVVSPIAGPVTVSAYMGPFVATATAQINVDVVDSSALPAYAGSFPLTTGTADSLTVLYPYVDTVLPLGLPPPIPQWQVGTAANAVKMTLRYVNGATSFRWAAIAPENAALTIVAPSVTIPAAPRYPNIPTNAWAAFEQSAKGQNAEVVIQRVVSGTRRAEVPTTIHFANGQLKGNVYYQSYGTQLARNFNGGAIDSTPGDVVFPGGAFGAATLAIGPGATQPTVIAGSTGGNPPDGAGTYCRVCHTAAADGSVLVTQKFGGGNTTSQRYSNLTGTVAVTDMSPGDGRFAWPAIFPTGGTTSGFLYGNGGVGSAFSPSPGAPGGLDGSNSTLTNALYSLATAGLGSAVPATYRSGGASPITISMPSSGWGLKGAVPSFSFTGAKIAMQHYGGRACATGTATQCTTAERTDGDKRSIAMMDFNNATKQFSNFKVLVNEPNTPCNTTFHPTQPCFDVWPTFLPNDTGLVYEREIFNNGNVSGGVSDFAGTRAGCDSSAVCNNDGTKAELWWTNITGAASPERLNAANGLRADDTSYLPVGPNVGTYCRVSGFACTSNSQCCSGACSNSRCTTTKKMAGSACTAASECESNSCASSKCGCVRNADCLGGATCNTGTSRCPSENYYTPPTMSYVPGHNATVEPVLNYEPTMNPTPTKNGAGSDEYYWVVFTSRRMFGNIATIDPWWSDPRRQDISQSVTPKKLWVAAIRANPTAGTDPSYPAFYLPGQEWISGNSKAYWVQNACKPGSFTKTTANECEVSDDCCAGSVCQLNTPVSNPAKRYCVPTSACVPLNGTCSTSTDCCSGRLCSNGTCQDPPPILLYGLSATYTRDFTNPCTPDKAPVWRFFDYQAILPAGTSIVVRARTAASAADLPTATPLVVVGTANPPSTTGWTSFPQTIDTAFTSAGTRSLANLRLEIQLNPSSDQSRTPTLTNWRTSVDCEPIE